MFIGGEVTPDELLNITKMEGYSNNGEMLSCKDMAKLAEKAFSLAEMTSVMMLIIITLLVLEKVTQLTGHWFVE
ncbi:unnamed protein product [Parnassius apollo]|uniref:(apollo) hypothetical protein n=1 Tax=Parnassius apollo TaxID=110799 RepID=A0A8S3VYH9_PARAO|nr:unnamed protein product [Parnassius apollo]